VPGESPHPRRHPAGHSHGRPEPTAWRLAPDDWQQSDAYLYGIDLYNFAYWWESHEVFEAFWHAAGRRTEQGRFFQALIQLAAANLKLAQRNVPATRTLLRHGIARLQSLPQWYLGLDVEGLVRALHARIDRPRPEAPLFHLHIPQ
jgi:predicted metal-dependent hydrolase